MKFLTWLKTETLHLLPSVIYFSLIFNLIHFTSDLNLRPDDIHYATYLTVTIAGLFAGKVILLTDYLPFFNQAFPNRPLIYKIIWKFSLYILIVFLIEFLHQLIHLSLRFDDMQLVRFYLWRDLNSPIFWSSQIWVALTFLVYVIAVEFIQALGKTEVQTLLFGKKLQ